MTRRCLVIACRVTAKPTASVVMDIGPESHSRETSRKRVGSPRAANTGAEPFGTAAALELLRMNNVLFEQLHHHAPTLLVSRECFGPAGQRDVIEAGLRDGQSDAVRHFLESKDNQRGRL